MIFSFPRIAHFSKPLERLAFQIDERLLDDRFLFSGALLDVHQHREREALRRPRFNGVTQIGNHTHVSGMSALDQRYGGHP